MAKNGGQRERARGKEKRRERKCVRETERERGDREIVFFHSSSTRLNQIRLRFTEGARGERGERGEEERETDLFLFSTTFPHLCFLSLFFLISHLINIIDHSIQ